MSFSINDFRPITDFASKVKKTFKTDRAVLYSGKVDGRNVEFWIPKVIIAKIDGKICVPKTFVPEINDIEESEQEFRESANLNDLPDYYPVYQEAKRQKLNIQNIGSHLILEINNKSTKLKDEFVKSGGERNFHIWNDINKEYYVFFAQYKPYFEEKLKESKIKD